MYDACVSDLDVFCYETCDGQDKIIIPEYALNALEGIQDDAKAGAILFAAIKLNRYGTAPEAFNGMDRLAVELLADKIGVFGAPKEE